MNPELEEQLELDRLIEEQEKDDSSTYVSPERGHENDVDIDGLENSLTTDGEGEVVSFIVPEKGAVLCGGASYHGTLYGARRLKCKCVRCKAAAAQYQRELRAKKKEQA